MKSKLVLSRAVKEQLEEIEEWVLKTMNMDLFWVKAPILDKGEVVDNQNFFDFIRTHGHDDSINFPPSVAVEEAVERCAIRDDLFLRVARAETSEEALLGARDIYRDLILILLWGVRINSMQLEASDCGSTNQMLETFKSFIRYKGY
tara:strand:+ start:536 stop:976 length:441 start_codon:yes stop_codon:yes gene_type:complete